MNTTTSKASQASQTSQDSSNAMRLIAYKSAFIGTDTVTGKIFALIKGQFFACKSKGQAIKRITIRQNWDDCRNHVNKA
jgi:hypothetical protein